ncbi:unnamed protein product [Effrenium voratum]|nr:unnamed protein product [Effrenium voratum]
MAFAVGASMSFVTLITSDDFLMAVQALASSLKATRTAHLPLLVLYTDQVSANTVSRLEADASVAVSEAAIWAQRLTLASHMLFGGCCVGRSLVEQGEHKFRVREGNEHYSALGGAQPRRAVEAIPNPHSTDVPGWVNSGFTKLRIWEQDDFAKLVYIDADCLVLDNIDDLFSRPCPAFAPDVFPPDKFNAGVIVLEPSKVVFQEMIMQCENLPSHDGGDTGFLNSFYPDWFSWPAQQRLPFRYNALRTMYWFTHANPGYWQSLMPLKVLHFCSSPKPWDAEAKKGDLEQIWWEHYLKSQMPF